ncbi:hypothetical protein [Legionella cherrii]|uniref:Uncharacterized protein n=1 Tax=Legionella cherrii TaxID=28084 RepID=A0ABY6T3L2_9GAMM|nr:hypothetical protein [Legionella cherrii]VEB34638.1 Uncharacterised protein [Legionella cherrii]
MEAKSERNSIIFSSEMNAAQAGKRLDLENAPHKSDKKVWLLRESSVPGLLTVTYYNHKKTDYSHARIRFIAGRWKFAPSDNFQAQEFVKRAEAAFSEALPEKSFASLIEILDKKGFNINKLVFPNPKESSKTEQLLAYTNDLLEETPGLLERYRASF